MRKSSLFLVSSHEDIDAAMSQGITFSTLARDAAAAVGRGAASWAAVCRYGSEDPERLESVAAIIAATESESARASLYAGARKAIKQHAAACCIITKRKADDGRDGYCVRPFNAAEAAKAANIAADKREATKNAKAAADAAAAEKAAADAAFSAAVLQILGAANQAEALTILRAAFAAEAEAETAEAA